MQLNDVSGVSDFGMNDLNLINVSLVSLDLDEEYSKPVIPVREMLKQAMDDI